VIPLWFVAVMLLTLGLDITVTRADEGFLSVGLLLVSLLWRILKKCNATNDDFSAVPW